MQLEQIVTSLEVSKKLDIALKKANIKVEPLFWWSNHENGTDDDIEVRLYSNHNWNREDELYTIAPALTASEIGEILPPELIKEGAADRDIVLFIKMEEGVWKVGYTGKKMAVSISLQDAMGEMLCYLADNELLK